MNGLFWRLSPVILLALAVACTRATPEPSLWSGVTPIGEILKEPGAWEGKEVKLLAYYRWFDVFGEAGSGPPVTRSDVAFADATGAIYATHWENPGLSPEDTDRLFLLRARVRLNPAGLPYLEVEESREVNGLPKGVVLRARLTGGIAGFNRELLVMGDGSAFLLDRKLRQHTRFKVEAKALEEILKKIRPFSGQELGHPVPDGFNYTLYFWEGNRVSQLTLHQETAPDELKPALEALSGWFFRPLQ